MSASRANAKVARDLAITIQSGQLVQKDGTTTDVQSILQVQKANTHYFGPESEIPDRLESTEFKTRFAISGWEPFAVFHQFHHHLPKDELSVGILASSTSHKPGDGFLNGVIGPMENLCHDSNLFASLKAPVCERFYNRTDSDRGIIVAKQVSMASMDARGYFLSKDLLKAVIIVASPVDCRKSLYSDHSDEILHRCTRILYAALSAGVKQLILDTFGCNKYLNDPSQIAATFYALLTGVFKDSFQDVVFSIPGASLHQYDLIDTFDRFFGPLISASPSPVENDGYDEDEGDEGDEGYNIDQAEKGFNDKESDQVDQVPTPEMDQAVYCESEQTGRKDKAWAKYRKSGYINHRY